MNVEISTPEEFFGFQLGSDRKLARWDKIVEYFKRLEQHSDKIKVVDMGPTTEGNPFLLVIISSPENLANLDRLREVNARLNDPRGLSEDEVNELVKEGKAIVCHAMSMHSTELGGTQMAPELAYELLTLADEETQSILDNVICLMVPSFNPDGQIMVTDWYNRWLGTEYEGVDLPWLYHKYVGHDNNRDAFQTNMIESQYMAKILYRDWSPQAYLDYHHMGSYGARMFVSPMVDPIHPHADPLVWIEQKLYGAHITYKLEEAGKSGVSSGAEFTAWECLAFYAMARYHNTCGLLLEAASVKLATPMYIHQSQLSYGILSPLRSRSWPHYKQMVGFPNPWPGGWWRLSDIVEYKKIAAWATLEVASRNKETVLRTTYLKAKRQIERGAKGNPYAYIIPHNQHDPLTAEKLIQKLLIQGIEVKKAYEEFTVDGVTYPEGTYVIFLEQPKMGVINTLLGQTLYPENYWTQKDDGSPLRAEDTDTDTMAEFMGVRVDPIPSRFEGDFEVVTDYEKPVGKTMGRSTIGYAFDGRLNDSFRALNRLQAKGVKVQRTDEAISVGDTTLPPGTFVAPPGCEAILEEAARETGLDFHALDEPQEAKKHDVRPLRVGLYQGYWGGNADEGWTRWLLESFEFPYSTVVDDDIRKGGLRQRLDVIVFADNKTPLITGEGVEEWWRENMPLNRPFPVFPPEYRSGIGGEGVEALKKFVEEGGTLVAFSGACEFAIEKLGLNVMNVVEGLEPRDFLCSGSTLRVRVDNSNPLAYGMPEEALVFNWDGPAFRIVPSAFNERSEAVVRYPERDILRSGRLIGEEKIAEKMAMLSVRCGGGRVVLFGFRPQHRGQTHGTFKLFFNTLIC